MRVGVGVITIGRRELSSGYRDHATHDTVVHIQMDEDRKGVAWARNQCIAALWDSGCDLIVLMDDDCYPIADGWQDYLIDGMRAHGLHVVFLENRPYRVDATASGELLLTDAPVGCFTAMTRHAVETIGYFSEAFVGYGYEDAHYRNRVVRSGINGTTSAFASLVRLHEFILSEDVVKPAGFDQFANMSPSEKGRDIDRNWPVYLSEMKNPDNYRNREGACV